MRQFVLNGMYEPKYKLNKIDEARWRKLVMLECTAKATPAESAELEKLSRKRYRKIRSHPCMEPVKRAERRNNRKFNRLMKKLKAYTK